MQTNIGQETRATQVGKWRDAVHAKTDLLLAFPTKPIEFCRECSAFSITTPPTETTEDGK